MSTISTNFTAVGVSASINISPGETFTLNIAGTFVGTVQLERSIVGTNYGPIPGAVYSAPVSDVIFHNDSLETKNFRLQCTNFTSGTIETELADVDNETVQTIQSSDGAIVFRVTEDGTVEAVSFVGDGAGLTNLPAGADDQTAAEVTVDDTDFDNIVGTSVQDALDSIDDQLGGGSTFKGVFLKDSGSGQATLSGGDALNQINWDTEIYDTDAFHGGGSSPTVTIPVGSGITKVDVSASINIVESAFNLGLTRVGVFICVNGNVLADGGGTVMAITVANPVIPVSCVGVPVAEGDTVEIKIRHLSPNTVTVYPQYSTFVVKAAG